MFAERVFAERCVRGCVQSCVRALFLGFSLCSGLFANFLCSRVRVFAGCVRIFAVFAGGFTVVFAVFGPSYTHICVQCSVFGVLLRALVAANRAFRCVSRFARAFRAAFRSRVSVCVSLRFAASGSQPLGLHQLASSTSSGVQVKFKLAAFRVAFQRLWPNRAFRCVSLAFRDVFRVKLAFQICVSLARFTARIGAKNHAATRLL